MTEPSREPRYPPDRPITGNAMCGQCGGFGHWNTGHTYYQCKRCMGTGAKPQRSRQ